MAGQNYAVQIRDRHSLPACDEAEHDGEAGGDVWGGLHPHRHQTPH